ncbi:hypothetical protein WJX73_008280 [Symbiochloris irregularis]|uniref:Uncharacterized protein n=1 Tax=Symbiochloris irregularis TaxID=706552 RepID=A0AAW1PDQ4_9CHLO
MSDLIDCLGIRISDSLSDRLTSASAATSHSCIRLKPARRGFVVRAAQRELLICVNKTCKSQGSVPVAQFAEDLAVDDLSIARTGCQGKCGNGPNMRLEPEGLDFNHISTPARLARLYQDVLKVDVSPELLKATELRAAGVAEARSGNLQAAIDLFTQALAAKPPRGSHLLLSNRSAAHRSLEHNEEAARDADQAVACAPEGFSTGYIRQVEAYSALEDYHAAHDALERAAACDKDFRFSQNYKVAKQQLHPLLKKSKPRTRTAN